ncbi:hypothetical protein ACHQM5_006312 [Ranunculus cassubicifolius]
MVYFPDSFSLCKSTNMANPLNFPDQTKQNHQIHKNRKLPNPTKPTQSINLPFCEQSRTGVIDVLYLIAVISAIGYLIFPYIKLCFNGIITIFGATFSVVKCEIYRAPMVYLCIGISLSFAFLATLLAFNSIDNKCGNPNCRGLQKSPEFDIQIETEDCVKDSTSYVIEGGGKAIFKLSQDHHKELEAELKKLAPPNGKAVLVFRARCGCPVGRMEVPGCPVGRMEVPGPKKLRKVKK